MSHLYRDRIEVSKLAAREIACLNPLVQTLTGTTVIPADAPSLMALDPGGGARNVDMAAVTAAGMEGKVWIIANAADAAEVITVRSSAAATIVTLTQNECAIIFVVGGVWFGYVMVA